MTSTMKQGTCAVVSTLCGALAFSTLHAQTVFVPDMNLRAWYNEVIPGVVDGAGYLDTAHAMWDFWGQEELALTLDWQPCDLTSLESLPQLLHLEIDFFEQEPTFSAWPPNLETLVIRGYLGTSLPPLPLTIKGLCLREMGTTVPVDLPEGLQTFQVQTSSITALGPLPASLKGLLLRQVPLQAMPSLPPTLEVLICEGVPVPTIDYPPALEVLKLAWMPELTSALPALDLWYMSDTWPWPDAGGEEGFADGLWIEDCPLLPQPSQPISALSILVSQMPWTALPMITETFSLSVIDVPLAGDLQLPDGLQRLEMVDVPISTLSMSGIGLTNVLLMNVDLLALGPFPQNTTLFNLEVLDCPNIVSVPPLTHHNGWLYHLADLPSLSSVPYMHFNNVNGQDTGVAMYSFRLENLPLVDSLDIDYEGNYDTGEDSEPIIIHGLEGLVWMRAFPPNRHPGVSITDCPSLICLPSVPMNGGAINLASTGVTCMPNYPSWVGQEGIPASWPPLCNVLNTSCSIFNPVIYGFVFDDQNANGIQESGEPLMPNVTIECMPGGYYGYTSSTGLYELAADTGMFTLMAIPPLYHVATTPAQTALLSSITDLDTLVGFGIHPLQNITDLVVDLTSIAPPVPGFDRIWTLTVSNIGTTAADAEVMLGVDYAWTWVGANPAPAQWANDTARWTLSALAPGDSWTAQVTLNLSATTPLGGLLSSSVLAVPAAQDTTPADNWQTVEEEVVGAFDPNDKTVSPGSLTAQDVQEGRDLEYTIRFQNTGTWPASRVVITDTLSQDLQWSTMRLIASSHPCEWYITAGVLHFVFDPIELPDSTSNEPGSHGFVKFAMHARQDLLPGAAIQNTANIVFDFNEPIVTEPAVFAVSLPENVSDAHRISTLRVVPNPAGDIIIVHVGDERGPVFVDVLDAGGRTVQRSQAIGSRMVLDIARLLPGIYHVRVTSDTGTATQRFVKL